MQAPNTLNQLLKWEEERLTKLIQMLETEEKTQQQLEPALQTAANLPAELVERPKSPVVVDNKLPMELKMAIQNTLHKTDIDVRLELFLHY